MIRTSKKIKSHIKIKEKKRSIRFKRQPLQGLQEGYYDTTNVIKQDIQPKSILKLQQSKTVFKNNKQELKSSLPSKEVKTKHKSNITQLNKIPINSK